MKLRLIYTLLLTLAAALTASAQMDFEKVPRVKPDIEKIKSEINNRGSRYYYPKLMEQFMRADTAMNLDEFRHLYLGFALQEDYNPYREPSFSNPVANLNSVNLTRQEADTVIHYANLALEDNPFDLQQMSVLISALRQRGQINLSKIWQYKFNYILMAIVSTGTGADEENAWYVIEPQHEYVLLNMMGLTVTNHVFYEPNDEGDSYYEYLTVVDGLGRRAGGYFFDIRLVLEEYYRKVPDAD